METKIHIYDINTMKILHSIDTYPNPKGICAFSPNHKKCFLAYPASSIPASPSSSQQGEVLVFDALSLHTVSSGKVHKGAVAAMAVSTDGAWLATASEKGTVVRVHSLPSLAKAATFRRGAYPAAITSLCFSIDGRYLSAASETGTIRILFRLTFIDLYRYALSCGHAE